MRLKKFFIVLTLSGTLLGVLSFFPAAKAQNTTKISVSPATFDFAVKPGTTETNVIKVSNQSEEELQLEVRVENIVGTGAQGQLQLSEEETEFALSSWVSTQPSRFNLKAKETRTVSFSITVPANAEPGGHYGTILIGTIASSDPASTGSATVQRVGSVLLVRVAGEAREGAQVIRFEPKNFVGSWDTVTTQDQSTTFYIAKEEDLTREGSRSYFSRGPVAFNLIVKATGNVHIRPKGFVVIYNLFGRKVAELALEERNIFPGTDRQLTVIWPVKQLWGGYYRAQLIAVYGQGNSTISAETSLWAFPQTALIVIAATLLLAVIARRRLVKVVRVLIRGQ